MGIIDSFLDRVIANSDFTTEDVILSDRLAWQNDSPGNDLASYPGPGGRDDEPGYEPTFEEEAEERGYQAGLDGAPACSSPTSWPGPARMAYATGRQRGRRDLVEREER